MASRWWCVAAFAWTGCYGDPDRFNEKQAELLCGLEDDCEEDDGWWEYGIEARGSESCNEARKRELATCNASCDYDEDAAQACIKELKRAARQDECSLESIDLGVCAKVYTDCTPEGDGEDELHCSVEPSFHTNDDSWLEWGCSVAPSNRAPTWALALFGLALFARHRRPR